MDLLGLIAYLRGIYVDIGGVKAYNVKGIMAMDDR